MASGVPADVLTEVNSSNYVYQGGFFSFIQLISAIFL
jgi:hypothetical protein